MSDLKQPAVELSVTGMTCASCVARVEKRLNEIEGVDANVNLATETATITGPGAQNVEPLIGAVEELGYQARLAGKQQSEESLQEIKDAENRRARSLRNRVIAATLFSLPVDLLTMFKQFRFEHWQIVVCIASLAVVVFGGWAFHRNAVVNLRHRAATMDTLVSLGVSAAWLWSFTELLLGHDAMLYFDTAATVTTIVLLGRTLEAHARKKTTTALQDLFSLGAKDVVIIDDSGVESRVAIEQLKVGNTFVVKPGEKIATDGIVVSGSSAVEQSMLTGESVPVDVVPGSEVIGATVNTHGRLVVRATKVGDDTALGEITRLVARAQATKAPVQHLVDRISSVFVPVVIGLSLITLAGWLVTGHSATEAFGAAFAVSIIACPCALGLATPTALLVGTSRGAQLGILIRDADVLEMAKGVNAVAFDKTGTLTSGQMTLLDVVSTDSAERNDVLRLAASVEAFSQHPIAQAVVNAAREEGLTPDEPDEFVSHDAMGVSAIVDGRVVRVGKPEFVSTSNGITPAGRKTADGSTSSVIAVGWSDSAEHEVVIRGYLMVGDSVKQSAKPALAHLRNLGMEVALLTGDSTRVAKSVASELGISRVFGSLLPGQKREAILEMRGAGASVAMVGDGVNDAPALAEANLGIALGTGADAAIGASDITVMSGDLNRVVDAIRLSRKTFVVIRSNLFWAFIYNVIAIPFAAFGLLSPDVAGLAMVVSSIFVVFNSLRLRRFKPVSG